MTGLEREPTSGNSRRIARWNGPGENVKLHAAKELGWCTEIDRTAFQPRSFFSLFATLPETPYFLTISLWHLTPALWNQGTPPLPPIVYGLKTKGKREWEQKVMRSPNVIRTGTPCRRTRTQGSPHPGQRNGRRPGLGRTTNRHGASGRDSVRRNNPYTTPIHSPPCRTDRSRWQDNSPPRPFPCISPLLLGTRTLAHVPLVAPGIHPSVRPSRCLLPLRFCRQVVYPV